MLIPISDMLGCVMVIMIIKRTLFLYCIPWLFIMVQQSNLNSMILILPIIILLHCSTLIGASMVIIMVISMMVICVSQMARMSRGTIRPTIDKN